VTAVNASGTATSPASVLSVPVLSVNNATVTLATNTAISSAPYVITNTGGTAVYSYTGTLPTGLSFNTSTGGITGTPTVATTGSGNTIVITGTNSSTNETSNTVSVTIVVTQSLATPTLYFPQPGRGMAVSNYLTSTGSISSGSTAYYPVYNSGSGTISGSGVPLLAVSTNPNQPIKYSTTSNPTSSSQWLLSGSSPNSTYVRPTSSSSCSLYNINGIVYAAYYRTSTSQSTKSCTVYANQDASTGWNAAAQTSRTVYFDATTVTTWSSSNNAPAVPLPTITNGAVVGSVGTPITYYFGGTPQVSNQSFGVSYSTSTGYYNAYSCALASGSLPSGLTLDPNRCQITGTPTAIQATTTYTLNFTNPGGTTSGSTPCKTSGGSSTACTFTVTITGVPQTISFSQAAIPAYPSTTNLSGTSSSGLTVSYSATGPCSVTGATLSVTGAGTCVVTASQAGNTTYAAATPVVVSITTGAATPVLQLATGTSADATITVLNQTNSIISFRDTIGTATSYKLYDANGVEVTTPPDGLAFNSSTGVLSGAAEVQQPKTAYYIVGYNVNNVASNRLNFTLTILALTQSITWPTMHSMVIGQADQGIGAIATSGMLVTYVNNSSNVCRINADGTVTALLAGTCSITATQPGDGKTYLAASPQTQTFAVTASLAAPNISLTNTNVVLTVGAPFPLPFNTINTGGTATYTISPALPSGLTFDPVYGVIGSSVAKTTSAQTQYTITATNLGAGNAVQTSTATFYLTVNGAAQSIGLIGSTSMTIGVNATQTLVAQLDPTSLLPLTSVTVTTGNNSVCTYNASTMVLTAVAYGTCVLTATQSGNSVYSPATATFTVNVHQAPTLLLTPSALGGTGALIYAGTVVANPFTITVTGDPVTYELHDANNVNISGNTINGLTFNTATGQLNGTTTAALALTNYTLVAVNAYGSASRPFTLTITATTTPITLAFGNSTSAYTVSGLTVNTPVASAYTITNTGTVATAYSITGTSGCSTALAGLTFSTTTGLMTGTPTGIPGSTYTCSIVGTNSALGLTSNTLTLTINSSSVVAGKPLVTTTAAAVQGTSTSWKLNGTLNASGASTSSFTYQFCYSTSPAVSNTTGALTGTPTCSASANYSSLSSPPAASSSAITFTAGTIYYAQIVGTNSVGTTYGNVVTFTVSAAPAVVTNGGPTALTATSFQVSGTVNNYLADTTSVFFCYSTTNTTYSSGSPCPSANQVSLANIAAANGATAVSGTLTGLTSGTTYYYQLAATNASGTTYGAVQSLTTSVAPIVVTDVPTAVGSTTATVTGTVNPGAASTTYTVWTSTSSTTIGTTSNFTYPVSGLPTALTGTTTQAVTVNLTGLTSATQYYYRLVAKNSLGTTFGAVQSFMTTGSPVVTVGTAVQQTATSFQLVGTVNPSGAATSNLQFCYNTTNTYSGCTAVVLPNVPAGLSPVSVTSIISGLSASTTYYFWLVADNGVASVTSSSGSFTTGAPTYAPTLTNATATSVSSTSQTIGATLNTGNVSTTLWMCYGLTADLSTCTYSVVGTYAASTSSTGAVTTTLTGLTGGTKYYYSFKATNSLGSVYLSGNFTTSGSAIPLAITTTTLSPNTATTGQAYSATLAKSGGLGPYVWSFVGAAPGGLSIDYSTGVISGTPTVAGSFTFAVSLTDSAGSAVSKNYSLTIAAAAVPLAVRTVSTDFPLAMKDTAFSYSLAAIGGSGTYSTWAITSSSPNVLPAGLSMSSSGVISGTPTAIGDSSFTVRVTDSLGATASANLVLSVVPQPLVVTSATLPTATAGTAYSYTLTNSGGKSAFTWALVSGTLPSWLTLNTSTGVLSGTPTSVASGGPFPGSATDTPLVFQVTDANSTTAVSSTLNLHVIAAPQLISGTFATPMIATTSVAVQNDAFSGNALTTYYICSSTSSSISATSCANSWVSFDTDNTNGTVQEIATVTGLTANTTYYFCFKAVNDGGSATLCNGSGNAMSVATANALSITTLTLPAGTEQTAYSTTLQKTGSYSGTLAWSVKSGYTLPSWLSLNATTGALTGTPPVNSAGDNPLMFVLTETGGAGQVVESVLFNLSVVAAATPVSTNYMNVLSTTADLTVQVKPGNLDTTIYYCYGTVQATVNSCTNWTLSSVNGTGHISGVGTYTIVDHLTGLTPGQTYYFRYKAVNSATGVNGVTTSRFTPRTASVPTPAGQFRVYAAGTTPSFTTLAPLAITPSSGSLANAYLTVPYSVSLTPSGGQAPYSFALATGSNLPAGLSMSASGVITGTALNLGSVTFSVTLTDSVSSTPVTNSYTILVGAAPVVSASTEGTISHITAVINASVSTNNLDTTVSYCYATTSASAASCSSWTSIGTVAASLTAQAVSASLSGLTASTTYFYRFKAVNAGGTTYSSVTSFTTNVAPSSLAIDPANGGNGVVGSAFTQTFTATGGTSPYTWSVSGTGKPAWLSINASTGVLSGTPPTGSAGNYTFTVQVNDSASHTDSISWTIVVITTASAVPSVSSIGLTSASMSVAVTQNNSATTVSYCLTTSSPAPNTCASPVQIGSGAMALGDPNPVVALTGLTSNTSYWVVIKTVNGAGTTYSSAVSFSTLVPLNIVTTGAITHAHTNASYTYSLQGNGGATGASYTWALASGSALPAGLSIVNGQITGTPTVPGDYSFQVTLTDGVTTVTSSQLTLSIQGSPTVTDSGVSSLLPTSARISAQVNPGDDATVVTYCLNTTGVFTGCTWNTITTTAATTNTLSEFKDLTGLTPNTHYYYEFKAANSVATVNTTGGEFITPATLSVATTALSNWASGSVGTTATLLAAGGSGSYSSWVQKSGTLPSGLSLATNGVLSGTTSALGHYSFVVTVSDSSGATADSITLTLDVVGAPTVTSLTSTSVNSMGATIGATVNPGNLSTTVLYCYSTTAGCAPSTALTPVSGSNSQTVSATLTGLNPSTQYFFNFSASNSSVVSPVLGTEATFTTLAPPTTLAITTTGMPDTVIGGTHYSQTLGYTSGNGSNTWSVSVGSLPDGLTLDPATGVISGDATKLGQFTFTVHVVDTSSPAQSYTQQLTINVFSKPVITETAVANPTFHSGVLAGTVNSGFAATSVKICFSTDQTKLTSDTSTQTCLVADSSPASLTAATTAQNVGLTLDNLAAATTYYWQIEATNAYGTSYGTVLNFTTAAAPAPLAITTSGSSSLLAGAPASLQFAATGGVPYTSGDAYHWAVTSGTLPGTLALSQSGLLTGSVSSSGVYQFVVTVYDNYGGTQSLAYTLTVTAPVTVTTGDAKDLVYNNESNNSVTLLGVVNPGNLTAHVWFCYIMQSGSNPPPANMTGCTSVDAAQSPISGSSDTLVSLTLSGDLQASKTYYYIVEASNNGDPTAVSGAIKSFTMPAAPAAMVITNNTPLTTGPSGTAYSVTFGVTNGTGPYTWTIAGGSMPVGFNLGLNTGTMAGTPSGIGTYTFDVKVTDAVGNFIVKSFTLVIDAPASATTDTATAITSTTAVIKGHVSSNLNDTNASFCWGEDSALAGCNSVSLAAITGASSPTAVEATISGLTAGHTYYYQVYAQNGLGSQALGGIQHFTAALAGALGIANSSLPNGVVGTAYAASMSNTNGVTPLTWTASGLPAGLNMSTSGAVTGNPTVAGTYTVTVTVTDANNATATQNFTVIITATPTVTSLSAQSISDTSATLRGTINPGNATTNFYFCYSTVQSLVGCTQTSTGVLNAGTADLSVSVSVTNLTPGTTYYYKVVAWNAASGQSVIEGSRLNLATTSPTVAPAPVTPPPPPTPTPTPAPKPKPLPPLGPVPVIEAPAPGTAPSTSGDQPEVTSVVVQPAANALNVLAKDWSLTVAAADVAGAPAPLNDQGQVVVEAGQYAVSKGTGFLPNSEVRVYLFSDPKLLGIVMTDANGNFTSSLPLPDGLEIGEHTLQVDGYTPDGLIRSANLLVLMRAPVGKVVTAKYYFAPNISAVSAANAKAIKKLAASIDPGYFNLKIGVVGFVFPYDTKAANLRVSTNRAKNVASLLKKSGLNGIILAKGLGRAAQTTKQARRVEVTVTYEVKTTEAPDAAAAN
jgi:phosphodiesterase/alkaline phosphatase D-like protein/outer membrane protein OmpA-like peptidoglycan-associated protein